MGKETGITWTDHTFNPWIGCVKVSAGCQYCYAQHDTFPRMMRSRGIELWGVNGARHVTSDSYWKQPLAWNKAAERDGVRRKVFCASLADVFEARDDLGEPRIRLWRLIEQTPALDWLLLTKRPENVMDFVPELWKHGGWPSYVWLGASAENQENANKRIPILLKTPAPIKFLSCEPLLGPIDLAQAV